MQFKCPNCNNRVTITDEAHHVDETISELTCPSCHSKFNYSGVETESVGIESLTNIGHFQLVQVVGGGSFGIVYKAWDSVLERTVAVKVPRDGRITTDSAKLFLKEARAGGAIQHPNIVSVYEVGAADGVYYIVSEFIEGLDLARWLRDLPARLLTFRPIPMCCS